MKQFIFLLRVSTTPLTAEQTQLRTQQWGALIRDITIQGKFVEGHIFETDAYQVSGKTERKINHIPVIDHNETAGGIIFILANDINEAVEISKRCPTIDFGGSVEVRALQPKHNN